MTSLSRSLEEIAARAPEQGLERILRPKLRAAGVRSWRRGAAALAAHLCKSNKADFHWEDPFAGDDETHVELEFTEEDGLKLEKIADTLSEDNLTEIFSRLLLELSSSVREKHEQEWWKYRREIERGLSTFRNNLEFRWGEALDLLRILIDLSINEGEKYARKISRSRPVSRPYRKEALAMLHARACQVSSEIVCLLENGFPNGAVARWRTLYEIEVTATVLADGTNNLAERYLDHEAVERKKAVDLYQRTYAEENENPLRKSEVREAEREYQRVLRKYDKNFAQTYGWATERLKNPSPRFFHLEHAAGGVRLRNRYKFASYNVHASSMSFQQNLSDLTGEGSVFVGASNAGLAAPGHLTAVSLMRITYLLVSKMRSFENLALINAMISIRDDTMAAFQRADALLREEDAAIRAAGSEYGIEIDTSFI